MRRIAMVALLMLLVSPTVRADRLTAVISPTGTQVLGPGCREFLEKTLGGLDLQVLPRDADAVTGDLVVNVTQTDPDQAANSPAVCELLVFVTPTGNKLATIEEHGPRSSTCPHGSRRKELQAFLQENYRVSGEPPGNLPQAKRTFMYLLKPL